MLPFIQFIAVLATTLFAGAAGLDPGSPETRGLLTKWGKLHAIRSALSLIAAAVFVWQLVRC
jgi:Domain of unknown function (DUF1772)